VNILVAVPCYDGKVCVETVRSLLNEQIVAVGAGCEFKAVFLPGCSLITHARNQIASDFLASKADRLVFIDADVSWEPGDLVRLAHHPVDFVAGAYRLKQEPESYPVGWLERPELWADPDTNLLEVASVPGGFMALNRCVFERLAEAHPDRGYSHYQFRGHAFFHAPVEDGLLLGEDTAFCRDWRAIGGQVWLDPELTLTHTGGSSSYVGKIGDWLKMRAAA
jgi:hypothetical protein